jgi:hypothetical protein
MVCVYTHLLREFLCTFAARAKSSNSLCVCEVRSLAAHDPCAVDSTGHQVFWRWLSVFAVQFIWAVEILLQSVWLLLESLPRWLNLLTGKLRYGFRSPRAEVESRLKWCAMT